MGAERAGRFIVLTLTGRRDRRKSGKGHGSTVDGIVLLQGRNVDEDVDESESYWAEREPSKRAVGNRQAGRTSRVYIYPNERQNGCTAPVVSRRRRHRRRRRGRVQFASLRSAATGEFDDQ